MLPEVWNPAGRAFIKRPLFMNLSDFSILPSYGQHLQL